MFHKDNTSVAQSPFGFKLCIIIFQIAETLPRPVSYPENSKKNIERMDQGSLDDY